METLKEHKLLDQKLYVNELSSGIKCYIIPKKGYLGKQAVICTKYGSLDNTFDIDGKRYNMPKGIAHFLEHKLFEEEHNNIFQEFIEQGAECNAFTNFTTTAYYFYCIDNFQKNFETLLRLVTNPYFTDDNVEKEKGIISQEIIMYNDDPNWNVYFNMMKGLYKKHPVRDNIAGTTESIKKITKEMLYDCYDVFYKPQSMSVIIVGDVDRESIYNTINRYIKTENKHNIHRIYNDEPEEINEKYIEQKMGIATPIFYIGFKDNCETNNKNNVATKILLDIIAGESSVLYNTLYNTGLIDNNFTVDYMGSPSYGMSIFAGFSEDPNLVTDKLFEEIKILKQNGIDQYRFNRIKKKHIGRFIRGLNSIDAIAYGQTDYFIRNTDLIQVFEHYENITKDDILKRLFEHFLEDNMSLSVITPL